MVNAGTFYRLCSLIFPRLVSGPLVPYPQHIAFRPCIYPNIQIIIANLGATEGVKKWIWVAIQSRHWTFGVA